jgi:signal transduction histidine kinase
MTEFWGTVGNVAGQEWTSDQAHRFLQDEIVTRREEAEKLLRRIDQANQNSLADSEAQFLATRTAATKRLVIVLGVCLFLGIAVVHFSVKYSENLERESADRFTELVEANRQLEGLSARLMEVQEEERTRLSRELHDEIVQNLAVLKMEIIQAQRLTAMSGIAREPLLRARELAERTVKTVRDISVLLRPSLLDDLGLCPALQWQAEEFSRRTGVHCDFSGDEIEETLPDAIKTCVYRVTQEALRNCEKHSRASRVQVAIRRHSGKLVVQVEDNGVGFPSSGGKSPRSLGLVGMRERAAIVGGALTVENKSTGGAIVRLSVPLPARTEVREMVEARA